jgi:hypothetical protein
MVMVLSPEICRDREKSVRAPDSAATAKQRSSCRRRATTPIPDETRFG